MRTVIRKIINGTTTFEPVIEPSSYSIQKSDLYSDSTGRSAETGVLLSYLIRKNIYTIRLEYYGNDEEIASLENMIDNSFLEVTFLDGGRYVSKTMYPSDREKNAEIIRNRKGIYHLSFSLIEY
ncbi:MAG: hypothetical protein NC205_09555 [Prevotella sp.]|nr:hypothetical protein [Alistipes senegalensis]MCM1358830.1 hypothetical protein [Prevotella sp.]